MTQNIKGKSNPLPDDEWLKIYEETSSGARDVLYYICTADPYSKGFEITVAAIASDLGVALSTVSRVLKELSAKCYLPEWFKVKFINCKKFQIAVTFEEVK